MLGKIVEGISTVTSRIAAVAGVAMTLLIFVAVVMRYFFVKPILFSDEVSVYLFIFVVLVGAAGAVKEGRFIRADILVSRMGKRSRAYLDLAMWVISIVVTSIVFWQSIILVQKAYTTGFMAMSVLLTPMWLPQSMLPVGLFFLILQSLVEAYKVARTLMLGKESTSSQSVVPDGT